MAETSDNKTTNHGNKAPYELKVLEVVRVDVGGRIDLETVIIFTGIFKQAVHGVQNLMGEQEKPLPVRDGQKLGGILLKALQKNSLS